MRLRNVPPNPRSTAPTNAEVSARKTANPPASRLFSRRIIYHEALSEPIAQLLSDDPQSTSAWAKGAAGEERLARALGERLTDSAIIRVSS